MLILFFFAFVSTASIVAISLAEITPLRAQPFPMLEQIERCMSRNNHDAGRFEALPLAA